MSENKCCGNCKHFVDKKVGGYGICESPNMMCGTHRNNKACSLFDAKSNNGWTEITPDNVDEIRKTKKEIVIMNPKEWDVPEMLYSIKADSLVLYSEWGGYYYYVLPELKIDNE